MLHGWPLLSSVLLLGVGQLRMCLCSMVGGHGRAGDADLHCEAISTEVMSDTTGPQLVFEAGCATSSPSL